MNIFSLRPAVAAAMLATVAVASADPISGGSPGMGSMNVSATVTAGCTDLTVGDLAFGSQIVGDGEPAEEALLSVTCDNLLNYTVELSYGSTPSGTQRRLSDGEGNFIAYNLFQPSAVGVSGSSIAWGTGSEAYEGVGSGASQSLPVFGTLSMTTDTVPGTYSDLVTVTLTF